MEVSKQYKYEPAGVYVCKQELGATTTEFFFLFKHQRIQHHGSIIIMKKKEGKKLFQKQNKKFLLSVCVCAFLFHLPAY